MDISENIKIIRERKKISQSDIAKALDTERTNYHRLEKRGDKLTIEQLKKIAEALGVNYFELLGGAPMVSEISTRERELEKRVSELEDRVKDKDFKIKTQEVEKWQLRELLVKSFVEDIDSYILNSNRTKDIHDYRLEKPFFSLILDYFYSYLPPSKQVLPENNTVKSVWGMTIDRVIESFKK